MRSDIKEVDAELLPTHCPGCVVAARADYTTATLFMDVNAGYRFGFFEPGGFFYDGDDTVGFYVAVQAGMLFSLGVADIGPRDGKPDWFVQGSLLVGLSF